jgi:hypothetical protein
MSELMPGNFFHGLKVSPDLSLSKVLELGVPSALAESDRGGGKIFMDKQLLCSAGLMEVNFYG